MRFCIDGKFYTPLKRGKKLCVKRWGIHPFRVIEIHEYRVNSMLCDFEVSVDEISLRDWYFFLNSLSCCDDVMWNRLSPRTMRVFTKDLDV